MTNDSSYRYLNLRPGDLLIVTADIAFAYRRRSSDHAAKSKYNLIHGSMCAVLDIWGNRFSICDPRYAGAWYIRDCFDKVQSFDLAFVHKQLGCVTVLTAA